MMKKITILLCALILLAGMYVFNTATGQEKAEKIIAVVDLNAIAENYEKHKDKMAKLKNEVRSLKDELEKLDEKLKGLMERREIFDPGSEMYEKLTQQIEELKIKGIVKRNTELKRLNKKQKVFVKTLYDDIRAAIKNYARTKGYSLVLVELGGLSDELLTGKLPDILNKINIRSVIYAAEELDITDKVIDYMNEEYRRVLEKKAKVGKTKTKVGKSKTEADKTKTEADKDKAKPDKPKEKKTDSTKNK